MEETDCVLKQNRMNAGERISKCMLHIYVLKLIPFSMSFLSDSHPQVCAKKSKQCERNKPMQENGRQQHFDADTETLNTVQRMAR